MLPPNWSAQTCPVRSTEKACVTDTILCWLASVKGSQTTSMGWNTNSGLPSIRSYRRRVPIAKLVTILPWCAVLRRPVRMPRSMSGMIASVTTSEWMPRSCRSARCLSASLVTRPSPICSVLPSSMMLPT